MSQCNDGYMYLATPKQKISNTCNDGYMYLATPKQKISNTEAELKKNVVYKKASNL